MASTKLWAVRTAIFDLFNATFTGDPTVVHNGPRPSGGGKPAQILLVGATSVFEDVAVTGPSCRSNQLPSPMDGTWRDELGEIDCAVGVWTGAKALDGPRVVAESVLTRCELALNADPQLGGLLEPNNNIAELTALEITEGRTTNGPWAQAMFTVSYGSLLT